MLYVKKNLKRNPQKRSETKERKLEIHEFKF